MAVPAQAKIDSVAAVSPPRRSVRQLARADTTYEHDAEARRARRPLLRER